MEAGGWRMEDGGWRMEDGGWRMEDVVLKLKGAYSSLFSCLFLSPCTVVVVS
jgi:hypothetical protein